MGERRARTQRYILAGKVLILWGVGVRKHYRIAEKLGVSQSTVSRILLKMHRFRRRERIV